MKRSIRWLLAPAILLGMAACDAEPEEGALPPPAPGLEDAAVTSPAVSVEGVADDTLSLEDIELPDSIP